MHDIHQEFDADWYRHYTWRARSWVSERIIDIIGALTIARNNGRAPVSAAAVIAEVELLFEQLDEMTPPDGP